MYIDEKHARFHQTATDDVMKKAIFRHIYLATTSST